mmetsp:Transcript_135066/g.431584  ORF Transcript_135066/g.431584 Transcript_135066/m.431584 type:complete len:280 (-) Transcript_135066:41-880(-)
MRTSCLSAVLVAASWTPLEVAACVADIDVVERVFEQSALLEDDTCVADEPSQACALSALQARGHKLSTPSPPAVPVEVPPQPALLQHLPETSIAPATAAALLAAVTTEAAGVVGGLLQGVADGEHRVMAAGLPPPELPPPVVAPASRLAALQLRLGAALGPLRWALVAPALFLAEATKRAELEHTGAGTALLFALATALVLMALGIHLAVCSMRQRQGDPTGQRRSAAGLGQRRAVWETMPEASNSRSEYNGQVMPPPPTRAEQRERRERERKAGGCGC